MAAYVVMERDRAPDGSAQDLVFVRDGFHWPAFLVPVFWLLWHRLWIEAGLALAATVLLSVLGEVGGFGAYASLLTLLVSLYFGLEGATLRTRALACRGWQEWGVVEAPRLSDAELIYASAMAGDAERAEPPPAQAGVRVPTPTSRYSATSAIGLVPYPGKP